MLAYMQLSTFGLKTTDLENEISWQVDLLFIGK